MRQHFLIAALRGDREYLARNLNIKKDDVLHQRNHRGETLVDEYRRIAGHSADRRISMLLAPPFQLDLPFVVPSWFFVVGGWRDNTVGIRW